VAKLFSHGHRNLPVSHNALTLAQMDRINTAGVEIQKVLAEIQQSPGPDAVETPQRLTAIDLQFALKWIAKAMA